MSTSYCNYSDLPPNLAPSQSHTPSYNRTPPPRQLGARTKNSPYPYSSSSSNFNNPDQVKAPTKEAIPPQEPDLD